MTDRSILRGVLSLLGILVIIATLFITYNVLTIIKAPQFLWLIWIFNVVMVFVVSGLQTFVFNTDKRIEDIERRIGLKYDKDDSRLI